MKINSGAICHPEIAAVTFLYLAFQWVGPNLIGVIKVNMVQNACISFLIQAWQIFFFAPSELYSEMKIFIFFYCSDIPGFWTWYMQYAIFKLKNFGYIIVFAWSAVIYIPFIFFYQEEKFFLALKRKKNSLGTWWGNNTARDFFS